MRRSNGVHTIEQERLLTAAEVGKLFGMPAEAIQRWARKRKLPSIKIGGAWLFNEREILQLIRAQPLPEVDPVLAEWGDSLC